jgi:undecaprenyl-diphosphatase
LAASLSLIEVPSDLRFQAFSVAFYEGYRRATEDKEMIPNRYGVPALLFAVILLGIVASAGGLSAIDVPVINAVAMRADQSSPAAIAFWSWISWSGGGAQRYVMVVLLSLWLGYLRGWRGGVTLALASLLSNVASDALKAAFGRARPDLIPHLDVALSAAYPSGHATNAAVVYLLFALVVPTAQRGRWLAGAVVLTVLTGLSRIALGVHWPSDVIGGWMLGAAFALAAVAILRRVEGER